MSLQPLVCGCLVRVSLCLSSAVYELVNCCWLGACVPRFSQYCPPRQMLRHPTGRSARLCNHVDQELGQCLEENFVVKIIIYDLVLTSFLPACFGACSNRVDGVLIALTVAFSTVYCTLSWANILS